MKNKIIILIVGIILINLIMISLVSAFEFDNVKNVIDVGKTYPQIEIINAFGLGETLWRGELNYNSNSCISRCSSEMEVYLGKDGILVEDVKFEAITRGATIRSYQFYYRLKGDSKWIKYILGTELKKGTYELKLEGIKNNLGIVDWQIETQGILIDNWALWGEANIMFYYDMENNTATNVPDLTGNNFNGTIIPKDGFPQYITNGKIGGAFRNFSGNLNEMFINVSGDGNVSKIRLQNDTFSLFLWANITSGTGEPSLFAMGSNLADNGGWGLRVNIATGKLGFGEDGVAPAIQCLTNLTDNQWHHVGVIVNSTSAISLWIDSVNCMDNATKIFNSTLSRGDIQIGNGAFGVYIDEIGFWNVTLNESDVDGLWNSGNGITYGKSSFAATLETPADNYETNSTEITFNCSAIVESPVTLKNMSLWENITGTWRRNQTNVMLGTINSSVFILTALPVTNFDWTCEVGNSDGLTDFPKANRTINILNIIENNQTFNGLVYETGNQTYSINISSNSSLTAGNLIWNGTSYAGTQSGMVWSRTIDIPTGIGNKTFHWNFTFGDKTIASTIQNVTINATNFSICGGEGGTTQFLNFTFKDEGNQSYIQSGSIPLFEATYFLTGGTGAINKSYLFTNTTASDSYMFCSTPTDRNLTLNYSVQYEDINGNYPQRISEANPVLSNDTTNTTLYLLSSGDGIYVIFQVINQAEQSIEGVHATATRLIDGEIITVGEGNTGADGGVTFFLNPDYSHTLTFVATGYDTFTTSLNPTQPGYTIQLGTGAGVSWVGEDYTKGVTYSILPRPGVLINNTNYDFNLTISSSFWEITEYGFILKNNSGYPLTSISDTTNGGTLNVNMDTGNNATIYMDFYWVIEGNYSNGTSKGWIIFDDLVGGEWSIKHFFDDLKNYSDTRMFMDPNSTQGEINFTLVILLFLAIFIFTGIMSYKFGLVSPAAISCLIFFVVLFLDVGLDMMDNLNPVSAIPHFITIFIGLLFSAILFGEISR